MTDIYDAATDLQDRMEFAIEYIDQHGIIVQSKPFYKALKRSDVIKSDQLNLYGTMCKYINDVLKQNVTMRQIMTPEIDSDSEENANEQGSQTDETPTNKDSAISVTSKNNDQNQSTTAENVTHTCCNAKVIVMRKNVGPRRHPKVPWDITESAEAWYGLCHGVLKYLTEYETLIVTKTKNDIVTLHDRLLKKIYTDEETYDFEDLHLESDENENGKETTK